MIEMNGPGSQPKGITMAEKSRKKIDITDNVRRRLS
jgi:hypothetical protein